MEMLLLTELLGRGLVDWVDCIEYKVVEVALPVLTNEVRLPEEPLGRELNK